MAPPASPLQIGRVVSDALGGVRANAALVVPAGLVFVFAPQAAWHYITQTWAHASVERNLEDLTAALAFGLLGSVARAIIILRLGRTTAASAQPLGDVLRTAVVKAPALYLQSIMISIVSGIGLMLLIVPGLWLFSRWSAAGPVLVLQRQGPGEAMGRSADMTEGNRWRIIALMVIYAVILTTLSALAGLLASATIRSDPMLVQVFIDPLVMTVLAVVSAAGEANIYAQLRGARTATDAEDAAAVFA